MVFASKSFMPLASQIGIHGVIIIQAESSVEWENINGQEQNGLIQFPEIFWRLI